jgi:LmeA-like phospholipid-binding
MKKLLVVVVVLALLGVAGDRVARKFATDEAQRRLVAAGLTSPQVDVRGFPFLTQLFARHFDDVRVTTASVRLGTRRADEVSGTARDVTVPTSGPATVGRLIARGTITYAEVLQQVHQVGLQLSAAGSGQVQLRRRVTALGRTYSVVAKGRVEPSGNTLRVTPTSFALAGGGAVNPQLSQLVAGQFAVSYRIRGLPAGVQIDRITAAAHGFIVDVSGRNVRLVT